MISSTVFWITILLLAAGTLGIRGSLIALSSKVQISARTREIFSYIPAAILPAFLAPAVVFHQGEIDLLVGKERLLVAVLATAICFKTRSTLWTILGGLTALALLSRLLGA